MAYRLGGNHEKLKDSFYPLFNVSSTNMAYCDIKICSRNKYIYIHIVHTYIFLWVNSSY